MAPGREYDIVVFGATGYTGKLTAENIAAYLPTDIRWAVAGRSQKKLEEVVAVCRAINPDRIQPSIEICDLDTASLNDLAAKTTVFVTTVGPYCLYGEPAFSACANNGTHYLDATGEVPYVARMIKKYHAVAQRTGAIMIPQIGLESAPGDLITYSLVAANRKVLSCATKEVILSLHDIKGAPSGGTLASVFALFDVFPASELFSAFSTPYGLSPLPAPHVTSPASLLSRLSGIRNHPFLGMLSPSLSGAVDTPIVHRSWGLLGGAKFYGQNFYFSEYMQVKRWWVGMISNIFLNFGMLFLLFPPVRWLGKKLVTVLPGEGPSRERSGDRVEFWAEGTPDLQGDGRKAFCKAQYEGSVYELTAVLLAQAALTILRSDDIMAKKLNGGVLTPATLGQPFIDRLTGAGFNFDVAVGGSDVARRVFSSTKAVKSS